jgi:hypothetical protein
MGVLSLTGTLSHGEACGGSWSGGCGGSPGDTTYSLGFGACPKGAAAALGTGASKRTIASPSAFVALEGAGTTVLRGDFLYLHSNADIEVRLTVDDGAGAPVVLDPIPHVGLFLKEFPPSKYLRLVEVKGSAQVAYLVSGPS